MFLIKKGDVITKSHIELGAIHILLLVGHGNRSHLRMLQLSINFICKKAFLWSFTTFQTQSVPLHLAKNGCSSSSCTYRWSQIHGITCRITSLSNKVLLYIKEQTVIIVLNFTQFEEVETSFRTRLTKQVDCNSTFCGLNNHTHLSVGVTQSSQVCLLNRIM